MKKLILESMLKHTENLFGREFPKSKFRIKLITGNIHHDSGTSDVHGMILLRFTAKDIKYNYKYCRASYSCLREDFNEKVMLDEIYDSLTSVFLNSLVFAIDELNIPDLLFGKVKPLDILCV